MTERGAAGGESGSACGGGGGATGWVRPSVARVMVPAMRREVERSADVLIASLRLGVAAAARASARARADDSVANRLTGRGQDRAANQIRRSGRAQPGGPGADADAEKERGSDNQPDLRGKATVQRADHALRLFSHALVGALLRGVRHFRTQRGAVSLR